MAEPRMEPPDSRKRISGQQYFNENERQGFANRLHGYARIRRAVAACTGAQRLQRRRGGHYSGQTGGTRTEIA